MSEPMRMLVTGPAHSMKDKSMKSELFGDDLALDVRDDCLALHVTEFERSLFSEHSECSDLRWLMAHLEIISAVTAYCGQNAFDVPRVEKWKARALELFDKDKRRSRATDAWRRKITDAFDRLVAGLTERKAGARTA